MFKLNNFYRYMIRFWKIEALALFLSSLAMAIGMVSPYLTKLIIDKAYQGRDLRLFIILISGIGIIFILSGMLNGLSSYLTKYVKLRVSLELNRKVFKKFQNMPYRFFQENSTGDNLYKINYDIEHVAQFIADLVPQIIVSIPKSILILSIILYLNPKMFIFVLALTPFLYIGPYYFTKILKKAWKTWVLSAQGIFKKLQETLSHMHLVKACGKEKQETMSYMKDVIKSSRIRLKNIKLETTSSFLNNAVQKAIMGLIIFYGGYQVIKGNMTLGSLSAISIYLSQLSGIQGMFANFMQQASLSLVSCDRLNAILDPRIDQIENSDAEKRKFLTGKIEFKNMTFAHEPDKKILDKIDFTIENNSCIALAGPSGCGKTTITNLILRLYQPLSGQILIDDADINNISAGSLYEQVGIALQEPYLWDDTLGNNIKYGREHASPEEIKEAAGIACIDGFINGLPKAYETIIGENACKISEGQKQRMAIARAVIKKPKILILDEALSSVDSELEEKIVGNIKKALPDSTIIIISHHLSTIKMMDLVYFLGSSEKIDIASHAELLQKNAKYRNYLACNPLI
ncbi:MAG: ABC transporter ATP-binding protein/permease [Candidatus Omnitrophica bacterium]|nr:ABC transporter ATP-binding protein/permease [Candidatus Omnitrophota bacterium]